MLWDSGRPFESAPRNTVLKSQRGSKHAPLLVHEEVFVHFLQIKCLINANTDIVPNHQGGEAFSINKHDLEWMTLCEVLCWLSEIRGGYEHTFIRFGCSETPTKCPNLRFANCVIYDVALCLDINAVKP